MNSPLPKLRFPEFQNAPAWNNQKLEEVSTPVVERVGDKKLTPVSISAGIGFVPQIEKFGRDISGNQYRLYTLVRDGDFVYNKGNSIKFPQGCVYILRNWGEVAAPNVFICFRLKDGYINDFFQYCFEKNMHGVQLKKHITSGARSNGLLNISKDTFFGIGIPTPSTAEQQKIADCLTSLDELITAQNQKVEALQAYKKGLMQNLFPAEGESVPRLRFPEFESAGEWEEKLLSEYFSHIRNGFVGIATPYYVQNGIPYLQGKNIKQGRIDATELVTIAKDFHQKQQKSQLRINDILMVQSGHVGECAVVNEKFAGSNCHALIIMTPKKNVDSSFFVYYFYAPQGKNEISNIKTGNTIEHILASDVKSIKVYAPSFGEQARIAEFLTSIDKQISVQSETVEMLKSHKKGLMQGLFPSPSP